MKKNIVFDFDFTLTNFDSTELALAFLKSNTFVKNKIKFRFSVNRKSKLKLIYKSIITNYNYSQLELNYFLDKIDVDTYSKLLSFIIDLDWNDSVISSVKKALDINGYNNVYVISSGNVKLIRKLLEIKIPEIEIENIIGIFGSYSKIKGNKHLLVTAPRVIYSDNKEDLIIGKWNEINELKIHYKKL